MHSTARDFSLKVLRAAAEVVMDRLWARDKGDPVERRVSKAIGPHLGAWRKVVWATSRRGFSTPGGDLCTKGRAQQVMPIIIVIMRRRGITC
jgi:hypothetical protein